MSGVIPQTLIKALSPLAVKGALPNFLTGITQDSRRVENNFVFAIRSGGRTSGADYIQQARERGAALLLVEKALEFDPGLPYVVVEKMRPALNLASRIIFGDPSRKIKLFGITGTNGKTSTVHILRSIFEAAGAKCGMLSTIGYWTGDETIEATLTTPDIDHTSMLLDKCVKAGATYATMEVSSHALDQGRVWGIKFKGAGFTNLSVDHLDYHRSMLEYSMAKEKLFRALPLGSVGAVNINTAWGFRAARACWGSLVTVGAENSGADLQVRQLGHAVSGGRYELEWKEQKFEVKTSLVGEYQSENIALASALALSQNLEIDTIISGVARLSAVPGRMESVNYSQPFAIFVDYAHTPDALQKAIRSLRPLTRNKIIVVFGCGGDRDRSKRPQMGRVASMEADHSFITSDNPRTEDPQAIADEILAGVPESYMPKATVVVDRREATLAAIRYAEAGDIVLIAGKGSEWYQEIDRIRYAYDDRQVAGEALQELGYKSSDSDQ